MKKITIAITLTVGDNHPLVSLSNHYLKYLLCDAFGEFFSHRGPTAEAYVEKRYPREENGKPAYEWLDREEKVRDVRARREIAETLRNACAAGAANLTTEHYEVDASDTPCMECPSCEIGNYHRCTRKE